MSKVHLPHRRESRQQERVDRAGGHFVTAIIVDTLGEVDVIAHNARLGGLAPFHVHVEVQHILAGAAVIVAGAFMHAISQETTFLKDWSAVSHYRHALGHRSQLLVVEANCMRGNVVLIGIADVVVFGKVDHAGADGEGSNRAADSWALEQRWFGESFGYELKEPLRVAYVRLRF